MADLVLGVAKSLVEGTLIKAQSAIEEETKLRQSAQRDLVFITGEFQMMQSFLKAINKEHVKNNIVRTWVTQVRDLAYDVEDCVEFIIHLDTKPDWWRRFIPPCITKPLPLDEAVADIQQLKARVEDVGQRNARYNLIISNSAGPSSVMEMKQSAPGAAVLGMLSGDNMTRKYRVLEDLTRLITKNDGGLEVISVWSRGRELETASIIRNAYDDPEICRKFQFRAWVKLMHPFNPHLFIQNLLVQFYTNSLEVEEQQGAIRGIDILKRIQAAVQVEEHLVEFVQQMNMQKYLIVLDDMSTMVEWDAIRTYLPDRRNGSRIIVSTQHFEIASFCTGRSYFQRFSDDHSPCVFFKTGFEGVRENGEACHKMVSERMAVACTPRDHSLIGRESQIDEFYREYLIKARVNNYKVVSVWGTPGVGKSAFVRSLFGSNTVIDQNHFQKYAWVDVSHPFIVRNFFRSLHLELDSDSVHANVNPVEGCRKIILKGEWCLIVIDNIQSTEEWDMIESALLSGTSKTIVVVITTEASVALYCADKAELAFNVKCLENDAAFDVFKQEVQNTIQSKSTVKEICGNHEVYKVITKCGGLPKVIISIACLLTKNPVKWKHIAQCLNAQFIYYLENKTELTSLHDLFEWMRSYFHALSDDLRQRISYLSIFHGSYSIRRRRLVMRWVAEGYFQDSDRNTAGEKGEKLFSDLLELSMIQQSCLTASTQMRIVLYKISSFFHEFIISRPVEENITIALEIFALRGHCHPTNRRRGRHLVIEECWDRDKFVFENIDFSRLRSLTVFGKWESFLVSSNMKVLRVLDLEDASGVTNKDVEKILKLLCRLKFLSLRGCSEVTCLPSSLGDLRQLQILDVKGTSIAFLPKSITNLKRLQYIRSGSAAPAEGPSPSCSFTSWLPSLCGACQTIGVEVPTGIEKLKAIHTLSVVNAGMCRGKTILKELQKLTQLHKLGVCGVNKKNCKEFCAAISCHVHLESLSVWLSKGSQDCLDDILPPLEKVLEKTQQNPHEKPLGKLQEKSQKKTLENLQSLKLYGIVKTVPAWIRDLPRLTKLELEITLEDSDLINKVLGEIKELCILRLCVKTHQDGEGKLDFCVWKEGQQQRCYFKVKILEIACSSKFTVFFGSEAMQNLELLTARCYSGSTLIFSEINKLSKLKLKEVRLLGSYDDKFIEDMDNQLKAHPRKPSLKLDRKF